MGTRKWRLTLATCALTALTPALTLADSLARAKPKDIPMLLDAATGTNSAYRASLIGETQDRVYFEYVTGIHASSLFSNRQKRVVYWLSKSDITDEQLAQFKSYRDKQGPRLPGGSIQ